MSMTAAEMILARASEKDRVAPGEYVTARIDKFVCHEGFAAVFMNLSSVGIKEIWDPDRVLIVLDHYVPPPTQRAASIHQLVRAGVEQYGIAHFYDINAGVSHQVAMEKGFVLPGDLVVGTDSHTCTYGALGAASSGIGFSEMAYAMATGELWFMVPETIRFVLTGTFRDLVTSKDLMLKIAGDRSTEIAQYKSIEFSGPAVELISMAGRMTMSNMSVEIGAKFCFFETDRNTIDYLAGRVENSYRHIAFDKSGSVSETYTMDVSDLEPHVALPHSVGNVKPISQIGEIGVHQAVIGSCTNGRLEDLRLAAQIMKGKQVHPKTRLLIIPASWEIYREAIDDGTIRGLIDAGGVILNPGCGPCFGSHMGLLAAGERCISTTNRNFKGRMGSDQAEVYLASPATVAASAVAGRIVDPRKL